MARRKAQWKENSKKYRLKKREEKHFEKSTIEELKDKLRKSEEKLRKSEANIVKEQVRADKAEIKRAKDNRANRSLTK